MSDTPHAVPFYCPFCGEQDLVPAEPAGWRCEVCLRTFELTTTRYFIEFFGIKASDREGIRRLLAEKAGVKFTPKPNKGVEDAPAAEDAPDNESSQAEAAPPPVSPGGSITGG